MLRAVPIGVAGIAALLTLTAPAANASPATDSAYLQALAAGGITFPSTDMALAAGHEICYYLYQGSSPDDVALYVYRGSALNAYQSGWLTGAAAGAYCPEML